jgi:hypothetical protein
MLNLMDVMVEHKSSAFRETWPVNGKLEKLIIAVNENVNRRIQARSATRDND